MKKILLLLLVMILISGCSSFGFGDDENVVSDEQFALYNSYYTSVLSNIEFLEGSDFYEIDVEVSESGSETIYYVFLDNPNVAMYDIEVIILENLNEFDVDKMMPTFGVFDGSVYNMVPYQVDVDYGYVEGIVVSGSVEELTGPLYMMVTWKDYSKLETYREFFEINPLNEIPADSLEYEATDNG